VFANDSVDSSAGQDAGETLHEKNTNGLGRACLIIHNITRVLPPRGGQSDFLLDKIRTSYEESEGYPKEWATPEEIEKFRLAQTSIQSYKKQGRVLEVNNRNFVLTKETVIPCDYQQMMGFAGSKRGEVSKAMSKKSAWNLKKYLLTLDLDSIEKERLIFGTFTLPKDVPDVAPIQRMVQVLAQKWQRHGVGLVWKREYTTETRRPHYHMLLVYPEKKELGAYYNFDNRGEMRPFDRKTKKYQKNEKAIQGLRKQIQEEWVTSVSHVMDLTDEELIKTWNAGIELDYVREPKAIAFYLADYLSGSTYVEDGIQKEPETDWQKRKERNRKNKEIQNCAPEWVENSGRWWGKVNCEQYESKVEEMELTNTQYEQVQDLIYESMKKPRINEEGEKKNLHTYILGGEASEQVEKYIQECQSINKRMQIPLYESGSVKEELEKHFKRQAEIGMKYQEMKKRWELIREFKEEMLKMKKTGKGKWLDRNKIAVVCYELQKLREEMNNLNKKD